MNAAIVLDTETTGLEEPQPIEVAYLVLKSPVGLEVASTFHQVYKPAKPITLGALATHHIMDEDVEFAPPYTDFRLPDGTEYLIGHNVDFDWLAIGKPEVRRIDTCCLARHLWPTADSHSLSAMLYLLFRSTARHLLRDAHSAGQDVNNCLLLLGEIVKRTEPKSWEQLWKYSEVARIPTHIAFGKHRGTAIEDLPRDYRQWILKQVDMDPYVLQAVRDSM